MPHEVFDVHAKRYDRWFDDHPDTYRQELKIIRSILGERGADREVSSETDLERRSREGGSEGPDFERRSCDLEIGVGTGRFAAPLGIRLGLDPSIPMLRMARTRGIQVIRGATEELPLKDASLRSILVMTSLCYFDDPGQAFLEMHRVLAPPGHLVIGFLGRGGEIAERYRKSGEKGIFLAHATFYTPGEVRSLLAGAGFTEAGELNTGGARLKGFHVMTATRPAG